VVALEVSVVFGYVSPWQKKISLTEKIHLVLHGAASDNKVYGSCCFFEAFAFGFACMGTMIHSLVTYYFFFFFHCFPIYIVTACMWVQLIEIKAHISSAQACSGKQVGSLFLKKAKTSLKTSYNPSITTCISSRH